MVKLNKQWGNTGSHSITPISRKMVVKKSICINCSGLFVLYVILIHPKFYLFKPMMGVQSQIFNWLVVLAIILVVRKLMRLSLEESGSTARLPTYISPFLVILGFASMFEIVPNYMAYNSSFFGLLADALPLTAAAAILVWGGLLSIKKKRIFARITSAVLTGIVSYIFIYNLAGVFSFWIT